MTLYTLSTRTYQRDLSRLPSDLRNAWLGCRSAGNIMRLTESDYAMRLTSGSGDWFIGKLSQLIILFDQMPISEPYRVPPPSAPDRISPADLDDFLSDMGL